MFKYEKTEETKIMTEETQSQEEAQAPEMVEMDMDLSHISRNDTHLLVNGEPIAEIIEYDEELNVAKISIQKELKSMLIQFSLAYWQNQAKRQAAELDNYKKRQEARIKTIKEQANVKLVSQLADLYDNMNRAIEVGEGIDEDGLSMIVSNFEKILLSNGIEKVAEENEPFNEDYHEALSMMPGDPELKGKIFKVVEQGFKSGDSLLKAAKVIVYA